MLLESRLSPSLYKTFIETLAPRQIVWGDNERQARVCMEDVSCMGIVGCRLNTFMERLRPIPTGCPVDELEPIGDRALTDLEWFWVDVYGGFGGGWQDAPDLRRLYDGLHLYPLETVLFLLQDGFVARSMTPGVGCHQMLALPKTYTAPLTKSRRSGPSWKQAPSACS